jgi:hypothetical protein
LNASPVFYLLGECANESVGLQIKTITITTNPGKPGEEKEVTIPGNSVKKYHHGLFAINTTRSTGSETIGRRDIANFGIAASGKISSSKPSPTINEGDLTTNIE